MPYFPEMNQYTYRPDKGSYLKLGSRAIGPLVVFCIFFWVISINFSNAPEWMLGVMFCGPLLLLISGLLIGLLRRYLFLVEIHIDDESIDIIEKNLIGKLKRRIESEEKFRLMKVNTNDQLTRIASSRGYTFGRFLSEDQLESILSLLDRERK
jgi:hypothetical protein